MDGQTFGNSAYVNSRASFGWKLFIHETSFSMVAGNGLSSSAFSHCKRCVRAAASPLLPGIEISAAKPRSAGSAPMIAAQRSETRGGESRFQLPKFFLREFP